MEQMELLQAMSSSLCMKRIQISLSRWNMMSEVALEGRVDSMENQATVGSEDEVDLHMPGRVECPYHNCITYFEQD